MALINGREYEFADLTLVLAGRDVTGFRGIKYAEKQEKEFLYGKGNQPLSIQRGNFSCDGEITLTQSELAMLRTLGGGSILRLNLNAVVVYGNPLQGDVMTTDKLYGIQFTESANEFKQGEKWMDVTIPFICLKIEFMTV